MGPRLVQHLEGSDTAKQRLEAILETLAGTLSVRDACDRLGIKEARFHQLRNAVLQAGLAGLEPRARGRRRRQHSEAQQRVAELESEQQRLLRELEIAEVRHELAQVLPVSSSRDRDEPSEVQEAEKKTKQQQRKQRRKRLAKQQRRRPR